MSDAGERVARREAGRPSSAVLEPPSAQLVDELLTSGPYKGLVPMEERDHALLFGRYHEQRVVLNNLLTARLTVLYGPSGAGKSSLLRAGVVHELRRSPRARGAAVLVFDDWGGDPANDLLRKVREAVEEVHARPPPPVDRRARGGPRVVDEPEDDEIRVERRTRPDHPFLEDLAALAAEAPGGLYLVLDQFESFLWGLSARDRGPERDTLEAMLPRIVNDRRLRVNVLLSLQEDALAALDVFQGRIDPLLEHALRIGHLDPAGAREAITRPLVVYERILSNVDGHEPGPTSIEPHLVDELVRQLPGIASDEAEGSARPPGPMSRSEFVPAVYLQLVLSRLWQAALEDGSTTIGSRTLERLGGVSALVRDHVRTALGGIPLPRRRQAARLLHILSSPSRQRPLVPVSALATEARLKPERVVRILDALSVPSQRVCQRVGDAYQIPHRVLADKVRDWTQRFQTRERRTVRAALVALVAGVLFGGFTLAQQRERALLRAQSVRSGLELLARDLQLVGFVPEAETETAVRRRGWSALDTIDLEQGHPFIPLAACDADCRVVHVVEGLGGAGPVAADTIVVGDPARPPTPFVPVRSGPYAVRTRLEACADLRCMVGTRWYVRTVDGLLRDQVAFYGSRFARSLGGVLHGPIEYGSLPSGQSRALPLDSLQVGREYIVVGTCEPDRCRNLDLAVSIRGLGGGDGAGAPTDSLLARDNETDATPVVAFVYDGGPVDLQISMAHCSARLCRYAVQAYEASPFAQLTRDMEQRLEGVVGTDRRALLGVGRLAAGRDTTFTAVSVAEDHVAIIGVCDVNCLDVDLVVLRGDVEIDADRFGDDVPIVTPPPPGPYEVTVVMKRCQAAQCGFGFAAFTRDAIRSASQALIEATIPTEDLVRNGFGQPRGPVRFVELGNDTWSEVALDVEPDRLVLLAAPCGYLCTGESVELEVVGADSLTPVPMVDAMREGGVAWLVFRGAGEGQRLRARGGCAVDTCDLGALLIDVDEGSEMGLLFRDLFAEQAGEELPFTAEEIMQLRGLQTEGRSLTAGAEPVEDRLAADDERLWDGTRARAWRLAPGPSGRVYVDLVSNDFDAFLMVLPDGGLPLSNDDGGGWCNARLAIDRAADVGYTVVVNSVAPEAVGSYTLRAGPDALPVRPGVCDLDPFAWFWDLPTTGRSLRRPGEGEGELTEADALWPTDSTFVQAWELVLDKPGPVTIDLASTDFDAYLAVLGPDGGSHVDDDSGVGCDARVTIDAAPTGIYRVLVNTAFDGEIGRYRLTVAASATPVAADSC